MDIKQHINKDEVFNNVFNDVLHKYWNSDIDYPELAAGDTDSFYYETKDLVNTLLEDNPDITITDLVDKIYLPLLDIINQDLLRQVLPEKLNINPDKVKLLLEYEATGHTLNLAKKRYAFYMIHPKEKLDIKGLETERSDYPRRTRQALIDIITMLLIDNKPFDEIEDYVFNKLEEFKHDLTDWDITLAKPVSYSKNLEEYKTIPAPVLGMLLYNIIVDDEVFRQGSRGFAFKIKAYKPKLPDSIIHAYEKLCMDLKLKSCKMDWLVLPEDITKEKAKEIIPEGFVVDVDEMIKFVWIDRVNLLLAPFDFHIDPKNPDRNANKLHQNLLWDL